MIASGFVLGFILGMFGNCEETATRQGNVGAEGARRISVVGRAGSLRVQGRPGLREVRVTGTACASSAELLGQVQLEVRREGTTIRVEARVPETKGWNQQAGLDFVVEIPESLAVDIRDSSGELEVDNVAGLSVVDGSGGIEIRNVRGDVKVKDGSGSITISRVGGRVVLSDNSGGISIDGADEVVIDEDGSGGIEIRNINRNVLIRDDGSGGIDVSNIGGDFEVTSDGSGGIRHDGVRGRVTLPRD